MGNTIGLLNQGAGILHSLACLCNHKSLEETTIVLGGWADYKLKLPFEVEMEKRKKRYLNN